MSSLKNAPEVKDLADELGLTGCTNAVEAILHHCRIRIDRWAIESGDVTSIGQLEAVVTQHLQMVFEEVRSDADFDRIKEQYARAKKDPVFASLRFRFDDPENPTFGALIRRNVSDDALDRFVAVIDCRGAKLARRFFTRWHEIAHRLTTHADHGATEPAYRSEQDPLERLMDEIAGQIGFYGPFFEPVFHAAHGDKTLLTFGTVESVRTNGFPEASFQATLNAYAKQLSTPLLYLEATHAYKKEEQRRHQTPSLFGDAPPPGELRAVKVIPNLAAHQVGFTIPTNMRVPAASVISRLFDASYSVDTDSVEDLNLWESRGKSLKQRVVAIEGRRLADRVIAIVQPVELVRTKRVEQAASMFPE